MNLSARKTNKPDAILIHCSAVSRYPYPNQLGMINEWHKEREFSLSEKGYYVGYHAISSNGVETITRGEEEEGAHCNQYEFDGDPRGSMNFHALGYALAFDGDRELPDPRDVGNMIKTAGEWRRKYGIPYSRIFAHRIFAPKTCYGRKLSDLWARDLIEGRATAARLTALQEIINVLKTQIAELMRRRGLGNVIAPSLHEAGCGAEKG